MTPVTMQKNFYFKVIFGKMASTCYNAVQVLDLLDANSSDSGSSGEKGDDIEWHYGTRSSVTFDLGGQQPQPLNFNPSSDRTIMESVGPSISSDTEVVLFY